MQTEEQFNIQIQAIRDYTQELLQDKVKARQVLIEIGAIKEKKTKSKQKKITT